MFDKPFIISIIFLAVTATISGIIHLRGEPVVVATNMENLPNKILNYYAYEDSFSDAVYKELDADINIYRHYRAKSSQIDLYIGYYGTKKGGRTPHNPHACFSSAGWAIMQTKKYKIKEIEKNVNLMILKKDNIMNIVFYWYQSDSDKILATGLHQNFQRLIGKIFKNKNDGAFVRISCYANEENYMKKIDEIERFSRIIIQLLTEYWPVEKEL